MVCNPRTYGNSNVFKIDGNRIFGRLRRINGIPGQWDETKQDLEYVFWLKHIHAASLLFGLGLMNRGVVDKAVKKTRRPCSNNFRAKLIPSFTRKFIFGDLLSLGIVPVSYQHDRGKDRTYLHVISTVVKQHLPLNDFREHLKELVANPQLGNQFDILEIGKLENVINNFYEIDEGTYILVDVWPQWAIAAYLANIGDNRDDIDQYVRAWATLPAVRKRMRLRSYEHLTVPCL